jgi:hypothetical protein
MDRRTTSRILLAGAFFVAVTIGVGVTAQTVARPGMPSINPQTQPSKAGQSHAVAGRNPACQRIVNECEKLGFIPGQWKKDNGLWKDCFDPIVKGGGTPTRDGRTINVPVSPSDVQACRAAEGHHR